MSGQLERVVLVGHMGSGKTTVGRELALRLGAVHVDSDELVEQASGRSPAAVIESEGVDAYRAIETATILDALARPPVGLEVWSLGGGALTADAVYDHVRTRDDLVVWLDADPDELLTRIATQTGVVRPLARDADAFRALHHERGARWSHASAVRVVTDARSVADIADEIAQMVPAELTGLRAGPRAIDSLARDPRLAGAPVVVVTDISVPAIEERLTSLVTAAGASLVDSVALPMGEWHKDLATVEMLVHRWASAGLTRDAVLIAAGGGTLLDTAGFAAATYMRGIDWISAPSTLLAQVDAGIGGKVAVNLDGRKNLLGAFHLPHAVVVDTELLATLPPAELAAGWAELLKTLLLDAELAEWTALGDAIDAAIADPAGPDLVALVRRCALAKARIVTADPTEHTGVRQSLNLGHTFAHAVEAATSHAIAHGPAVAIGVHAALACSEHQLGLDPAVTASWIARADAAGLPVGIDLPWDQLSPALGADKKRVHGEQRWVLLAAPGEPRTDQTILEAVVADVWQSRVRACEPSATIARGGGGRDSTVLVLFGVNLGQLGRREPEHYGSETLAELSRRIEGWAAELGLRAVCRQTDSLPRFLAAIHEAPSIADALIVNPGAWTHHERSLADALSPLTIPVAEVHLSAIEQRPEPWRRVSVIADAVNVRISGEGAAGYEHALRELAARIGATP